MTITVEYDPFEPGDEFPWVIAENRGVIDRFATQAEAEQAAEEMRGWT